MGNAVKPTLWMVAMALFCFSCQQSKEMQTMASEAAKAEDIPSQTKQKATPIETIRLTQENAEEVLLNFGKSIASDTVRLQTTMGDILIKLYQETPLHRANFLMLTQRKFYDETLFYRVMKDFMIQGGDSDDLKFRGKKRRIGKYKIPAEINPAQHFHKRGAVAMAREYDNNPEKLSSTYEFYIVQSGPLTPLELQGVAEEYGVSFTEIQKQVYTTIGGAPHLDGEHTVFGEVVEGMNVVDKIANVEVGEGNWPIENVMVTKATIVE